MKRGKTTGKEPSPGRGWTALRIPGALAALAFLVYANALGNGFVSDDNFQLLNNPLVTGWEHLPKLFAGQVWSFAGSGATNYYRPLQMLLYLLLHQLAGFHAFTFHLVMVAIHVANTLLVYALGRRLLKQEAAAMVAAALFAVHPIHTEAVVWVAVLPDVLITLLVLLSLHWFARQGAAPRGWRQTAGHCGLYLAALLAKETGAVLPFLLAGYEWLYLRRSWREVLRNARFYGALLATLAGYLVLRYAALGALAPGQNRYHHVTPLEFFLSAVTLAGQYLWKLIEPFPLTYYYLFEPVHGVTLGFSVALLALLAAAAVLALRLGPPLVTFGLWSILLPLVPALNVTGVGENVFAERYLYLPSVGFVFVAAWAWTWLGQGQGQAVRRPGLAWGLAAVLLLIAAVGTVRRNADWHDDIRLFSLSVQQTPRSAMLHGHLGLMYQLKGEFPRAAESYRRALEIAPHTAEYHSNLGSSLYLGRKYEEAKGPLRRAIELKPDFEEAHFNLGLVLAATGDEPGAVAEYRRTLDLKPGHANALLMLGLARAQAMDYGAAIDLMRRAIAAKPDFADAYINLGAAYNDAGRYAEGAEVLRRAVEVGANHPLRYMAHYNLGNAYYHLNAPAAAAAEFRRAWQLRPGFRQAKEMAERIDEELRQ